MLWGESFTLRRWFVGVLILSVTVVVLLTSLLGYANYRLYQEKQVLLSTISEAVHLPVKLGAADIKWRGFTPHLSLTQLVILDKQGQGSVITIDEIKIKIHFLESLMNRAFRVKQIMVEGPKLQILWDGKTHVSVVGVESSEGSELVFSEALTWIASQKQWSVHRGEILVTGPNDLHVPLTKLTLFLTKTKQGYDCQFSGAGGKEVHWQGEYEWERNPQGGWELTGHQQIHWSLEGDFPQSQFTVREQIDEFGHRHYALNMQYTRFEDLVHAGEMWLKVHGKSLPEENVSGDIKHLTLAYTPHTQQGEVTFSHQAMSWVFPSVFTAPLEITEFNSTLYFKKEEGNRWRIGTEKTTFTLEGVEGHCSGSLMLGGETSPFVDLKATVGKVPLVAAKKVLPVGILDQDLHTWLLESLQSGFVRSGEVVLRGNIREFPFDSSQGEYHWGLGLEDITLAYHPQWPQVDHLSGTLHVNKRDLTIIAEKAEIMGIPVNKVETRIHGIGHRSPVHVVVDTGLDTTVSKGVAFLHKSPLAKIIGEPLKALSAEGKASVLLALDIPLAAKQPVHVTGKVGLDHGTLRIPDSEIAVTQLAGVIQFTEIGVTAPSLTGVVFNQPFAAKITTQGSKAKKHIHLALQGRMPAEKIVSAISSNLENKVLGMLVLQGDMKIPWEEGATPSELTLRSDTYELALELPEPFSKPKGTRVALNIAVFKDPSRGPSLSIDFENRVSGKFIFTEEHKHFSLRRGHLVLGSKAKSDWTRESAFLIGGSVPTFDWDQWKGLLEGQVGSEHHIPIQVAVFIGALKLYSTTLRDLWVRMEPTKDLHQLMLESTTLKGTVTLPNAQTNVLKLNLDYLKLLSNDLGDTNTLFGNEQKRLPFVRLVCQQLEWNRKALGRLSLDMIPVATGYRIEELALNNPVYHLSSYGLWRFGKTKNFELKGKVSSVNFGRTLKLWQLTSALKEGNGDILFDLRGIGSPFQFAPEFWDGYVDVRLHSGQILGVNPGIGRILGLFSLDSLSRRLKGDFSDVYEEGFAFDTFQGDFRFDSGNAKTQELFIEGPGAGATLKGKIALRKEELDLTMAVTPQISTTIPLAAAIAVNPAVGAAVWLVDKATGSRMSQIVTYHYRVTGPWSAPVVAEVRGDKF